VTPRVEFLSLEVEDFGPFRGYQSFDFATGASEGKSALTVITGGGGSGKTSLVSALRLALWGPGRLSLDQGLRYEGHVRGSPGFWPRHVDSEALTSRRPRAYARVTLRAVAEEGLAKHVVIERSVREEEDRIATTLWVDAVKEGEDASLTDEGDFSTRIAGVLPEGRCGHMFAGSELFDRLAGLASGDPRLRRLALREVAALKGFRALETWRKVGAAVVEFGNRLLAVRSDLRLLPDDPGGPPPGAQLVVPGVWVSREATDVTDLACIGCALVVGLHLSKDAKLPLVLDAPALRMMPGPGTVLLEALSEIKPSQVTIFAHEEQVDDLVLSMWDRVRRAYLIERAVDGRTVLLSEPVTK